MAFGGSDTQPTNSAGTTSRGGATKGTSAKAAGGGNVSGNFCNDMRALERRHPGLTTATPKDLPEIGQAAGELRALEDEAPAQIKDDFVKSVDYLVKATSGHPPGMSSSEYTGISSRVDTYLSDHCNLG